MSETTSEFFREGERFFGYVVQRRIGSGSVGAVYLVRHEILDTLYALKVLDPSVAAGDPTFVKRFLREARLATHIRHPNLVTVHDCGHDTVKGIYYLVMDYVPGGSLRDLLGFEGKLPVDRAADIVAQVASALDAAQAFQVVHRDLKPENIMIQPDGRVKLVDLGIAKAKNLGDSLRTNTDSVFGTPSYVSPEQAQSSADVDARADIYSLGVVFFEMLTGKCPYVGRSPAQILAQILSDDAAPDIRDVVPDTPPGLATLIRRMMVKDRNRRIPSFSAVLKELRDIGLGGGTTSLPSAEFAERPSAGMKTILSSLGQSSEDGPDPLAKPDDDLKEFMSERTRRLLASFRRKRFLLVSAALLAVVFLTLLIVLL